MTSRIHAGQYRGVAEDHARLPSKVQPRLTLTKSSRSCCDRPLSRTRHSCASRRLDARPARRRGAQAALQTLARPMLYAHVMLPIHVGTRKAIRVAAIAAGVILLGLQLVPYGRDHVHPPVVMEPDWDQPSTRELAARACFDCHSNETRWPWYSNVAPVSWFLQRHVDEGRKVLNFSEWQRPQEEASESAETILEGEMPLTGYALLHAAARLSPAESQALARGLTASVGATARTENDAD
jgi:hypothetical protein